MTRYGGIRLGDSHTGGGTMLEASGFPVNGINLCVIGDRGYCPKHGGSFPLVSTGNPFGFTLNGRQAVYEPAKLGCGCSAMSSCRDFFAWVDESGAGTATGARAAEVGLGAAAGMAGPRAHAVSFRFTDSATGVPLARQPVLITFGGHSIHHVTDDEGCTELVYSRSAPVDVRCTVLGIDDLFKESDNG